MVDGCTIGDHSTLADDLTLANDSSFGGDAIMIDFDINCLPPQSPTNINYDTIFDKPFDLKTVDTALTLSDDEDEFK